MNIKWNSAIQSSGAYIGRKVNADFTKWIMNTFVCSPRCCFSFFLSLFLSLSLFFAWQFKDIYVCMYQVQNVFLRCPTPRLHCFLSSHWPSFRFLSSMAFFIPSIQFFFGLPRALFLFSASTLMLFGVVFLLPFFEHGHTMWAGFKDIYPDNNYTGSPENLTLLSAVILHRRRADP